MMGMGAYYELHWIVFVIGMSVVIGLGPLATLICVNYVSLSVCLSTKANMQMFDSFHGSSDPGDSNAEAAPFWIGVVTLAMFITLGFVSLRPRKG